MFQPAGRLSLRARSAAKPKGCRTLSSHRASDARWLSLATHAHRRRRAALRTVAPTAAPIPTRAESAPRTSRASISPARRPPSPSNARRPRVVATAESDTRPGVAAMVVVRHLDDGYARERARDGCDPHCERQRTEARDDDDPGLVPARSPRQPGDERKGHASRDFEPDPSCDHDCDERGETGEERRQNGLRQLGPRGRRCVATVCGFRLHHESATPRARRDEQASSTAIAASVSPNRASVAARSDPRRSYGRARA